jgi:hypothetical protein
MYCRLIFSDRHPFGLKVLKTAFQLQPPHQIGFPLLEAVTPSKQ